MGSRVLTAAVAAAGVVAVLSWTVAAANRGSAPDAPAAALALPDLLLEGDDADARRASMIRSARLHPPAVPSLAAGAPVIPAEPARPDETLECRYVARQADGTSAKFDCALADGRIVKVKYGRNPEIHAETLATTLLTALGYAVDRVTIVPRVRCYGCPRFPFATMQLAELFGAGHLLAPHGFEDGYTDFAWASVEQRFPARAIETPTHTGWAWFELDESTAPPADVGALRLLAVFLAHWDNKADNQRLVCLDAVASDARPTGCSQPLLMIQDLGSTFGPAKLNVETWSTLPVWKDRARCLVTMRHLPFHGSTFPDVQIPEAGRAQLTARLAALSESTIRQMLTAARVPQFQSNTDDSRDLEVWTAAFRSRIDQLTAAGPCPDTAR